MLTRVKFQFQFQLCNATQSRRPVRTCDAKADYTLHDTSVNLPSQISGPEARVYDCHIERHCRSTPLSLYRLRKLYGLKIGGEGRATYVMCNCVNFLESGGRGKLDHGGRSCAAAHQGLWPRGGAVRPRRAVPQGRVRWAEAAAPSIRR